MSSAILAMTSVQREIAIPHPSSARSENVGFQFHPLRHPAPLASSGGPPVAKGAGRPVTSCGASAFCNFRASSRKVSRSSIARERSVRRRTGVIPPPSPSKRCRARQLDGLACLVGGHWNGSCPAARRMLLYLPRIPIVQSPNPPAAGRG